MDNGIVSITIASPEGTVTGIKYNGIDNILNDHNEKTDRGYASLFYYLEHTSFIIDKNYKFHLYITNILNWVYRMPKIFKRHDRVISRTKQKNILSKSVTNSL